MAKLFLSLRGDWGVWRHPDGFVGKEECSAFPNNYRFLKKACCVIPKPAHGGEGTRGWLHFKKTPMPDSGGEKNSEE